MPTITTKDGAQIYYKDWGKGQPIVFSHGWPLDADAWDGQMLFFGQHGYRVIAHDRRGHGRSPKPGTVTIWTPTPTISQPSRRNSTSRTHSRGPLHRRRRSCPIHWSAWLKRVAMAVLVSAVPPLMLKTDKNPAGAPIEVFDDLRAQ